jgi:hypothetical protein
MSSGMAHFALKCNKTNYACHFALKCNKTNYACPPAEGDVVEYVPEGASDTLIGMVVEDAESVDGEVKVCIYV